MSILSADGTFGNPGMVITSPQIDDDEFRAGRQPHLAHVDRVAARRAARARVGRERILRLRDADGVVPVAVRLQLLDLLLDLRVRRDVRGAVDLRGDRLDLVPQRLLLVVHEAELRLALLDDLHHLARDIRGARAALGPVPREHQGHVELLHGLREELVLRGRVRREMIDRDDAGQAVMVAHVVHVALEIRDAFLRARRDSPY